METVRTSKGTTIAYEQSGSGPPLVIVHGSISDASSFQAVRSILEQRFTVYAMNRRGREGSSPMGPHALEDEFEDVAAVVDVAGQPVHLFGHSYGAHCAIGAALSRPSIRSIMIYEPAPWGADAADSGMDTELRKRFEAGDPDGVIETFLRIAMDAPDALIDGMKQSPMWPAFVSFAPSLVDEVEALVRYDFDPNRFAQLDQPWLLLLGDQSPERMHEVVRQLEVVLHHATVVMLPGQGHTAHVMAPELLAGEMIKFLETVE